MNDVFKYLRTILKPNDTIILGLSGGPDSMCLLDILLNIRKDLKINIICAHVNHNVREESAEEEIFVKNFCEEHNCTFESYKILKYDKENFESNARTKRYNFFNELVKKYGAKFLVTAHHGDDLIETILMRLVRGSNVAGYAGFRKTAKLDNYTLIRPLLYVTKKDIEDYNIEHNIPFRIDKTNNDDNHTRNRYRHQMLPFLKKENPKVHLKFLEYSEELYLIDEFLVKETEQALTKVYSFGKLNLCEFNKLDLLLKKRVIETILNKEYQNNINNINKHHLDSILKVCESSKANVTLSLPLGKTLIKSYNELFFYRNNNDLNEYGLLQDQLIINNQSRIVKITKTEINKSNYLIRLNSKELNLPLYVRTKKDGDKIYIKNLNGSQKVKDVFINSKIPKNQRDTWPIVVDSKDNIIWIPGVKKSKFDKNNEEFYDIIYKYVISEEKKENE